LDNTFKLEKTDTVVMDLLSNVTYMGTNEEGLPKLAITAGACSYYIPGLLTTAPPPALKKKSLEAWNTLAGEI
jgi:hypothetical protein